VLKKRLGGNGDMKRLLVLRLNDVEQGFNGDFYSEQLDYVLGEEYEHISDTNYYWTDSNYILDIERDVDVYSPNIHKAIQAGATLEMMYYVDHHYHQVNFYDFEEWVRTEGFSDCVEYGEEHGIIFKLKRDAQKYQSYLDLVKINDFIKKEEALNILENISLEEVAERLLKIQRYEEKGAVCYLDLDGGRICFSKDRRLNEYEIEIMKIGKYYNRFDKRETYYVNEWTCCLEEFDAVRFVSTMKIENYEAQLEECYEDITNRLEEIHDDLKEYGDLLEHYSPTFQTQIP